MSDSFSPDFGVMSRAAPPWSPKRPLRIAVLGDFGAGAGRGCLHTGAELGARKPLPVEFDTLEDALRRLLPSLSVPLGADAAPVRLDIRDLDAFHPDSIYAEVPLFAELASLRKRLNHAGQRAAAAAEVSAWAGRAGARASSLARQAAARGSTAPRGAALDDFARLTGRASSPAGSDRAIAGLLQRVVAPFVQPAARPDHALLLAAVDAASSDAMRALLHHPDFQVTESLWRGVDFVLRRLETGPQLQVHLLDLSAEEFAADLGGAHDLCESALYRLLVDAPAQEAGGGYGYIAGCYRFDATPAHAELLGRAAKIASHAGASLLLGIYTDAFADRNQPPPGPVQAAFAALRALPAASFLGLFGPRFLLRHPYGRKSDPISAFDFEEFSREAGLRSMLWGHPALLALTVLARPGAPPTIDDLPFHHFVDDHGDTVALPCTERLISANVASLLRAAGINALMAHKGEARVRFNGIEAVNGGGLAVAGAARKATPSDARIALQSRIDTDAARASGTFAPATRTAVGADESAQEEAEPSADAPAEAGDEAQTSAGAAESTEEPAAPAEDESAPPMDPDLEALLKSLG
jgi:type VI secretion system protein ImpC